MIEFDPLKGKEHIIEVLNHYAAGNNIICPKDGIYALLDKLPKNIFSDKFEEWRAFQRMDDEQLYQKYLECTEIEVLK